MSVYNYKIYYTPLSDAAFKELKQKVTELWKTYDNKYGYVDEKLKRIEHIYNVSDNGMFMVAMFDNINQYKLSTMLSPETRAEIAARFNSNNTIWHDKK